MKPTDKTLLEQMKFNEAEIHQRKGLLNFTRQDEVLLLNCQVFIQSQINNITSEFYKRLTQFDEIVLIIGDADTLKRLMSAMKDYIKGLFSGKYDLQYVNTRLRIGLVHKRIGVSPKYYISAVKTLKEILSNTIKKELKKTDIIQETLNSLDKILSFDTELVFDTYIKSLVAAVDSLRAKAEQYSLNLEQQVIERTKELNELSRKDGLTNLYNHKAFIEFLKRDIAYAKRNKSFISLIYFDVDKFKTINDTLGHLEGDNILKSIGQILKSLVREIDVPCRYGGDEFCVILSGNIKDGAKQFCERLIKKFSAEYPDITLSIGVAETGPKTFDNYQALIKRADEAMYEAKKENGFQIKIG